MIRFESPEWFSLFYLLPVIIVLFVWFNRQADARRKKFASAPLLPRLLKGSEKWRRNTKFIIFICAASLSITALARPQLGVEPKEAKQVGIDILIALDVSLSMLAEDIAPNRLAKAKREIEKLADAFAGNRVGLLIFAGESSVEAPLTLDVSTFKLFLNSLAAMSMPVEGTDITGALVKSISMLDESKAKSKVIVLITDGEDNEGDPVLAAEIAAEKKIRIFTIGLGGTKGVPIPIRDDKGNLLGYKKDRGGNTVMTKLNSSSLAEVAEVTDAEFVSSEGGRFDIDPVINSIKTLEKSDITSTRFTTYIDRFQWLIALVLILLFLELLI
jgi:Ca-activated chloride channel family protein